MAVSLSCGGSTMRYYMAIHANLGWRRIIGKVRVRAL